MVKCPECNLAMNVELIPCVGDGFKLELTRSLSEDKNLLISNLHNYWRWCTEGKPSYKTQYYYDDYHNHIKYDPEQKLYHFAIQTFDSPEGDSWWRGNFRYNGKIELIP